MQREYRRQNADKVASCKRSWRQANREHVAASRAEWKQANPDAVAAHRAKARAIRYGAKHEPYSRSALFSRWGGRCCYCDAEATSVDHVEPLGYGGHDVVTNVVPACQPCNSSKGRRSLAEWAQQW